MKTTINFCGTDFQVIAHLDGEHYLIAHPNGPAICDGDWLGVIDAHQGDSSYVAKLKRLAVEKFREWARPILMRSEADKEERERMRAALDGLLERYVSLVNSGDGGSWNPETEAEVIAARAAIGKPLICREEWNNHDGSPSDGANVEKP